MTFRIISRPRAVALAPLALLVAGLAVGGASAQTASTGTTTTTSSPAKKEYIARILKAQQAELDSVSRSVVERPAAQLMQQAGAAIQQQVPADKREAAARSVEAEIKKFVDESYPLVRERAIKLAPSTIGAVLDEKMSEDELKQFVAWLESPANKKFQQLGPDMRNAFIGKLLNEAQPVVDPKLQALDGRIRTILGLGPAERPQTQTPAPPAPRATPPAARASGK